jgi:hypothetical protein
MENWPKVSHVAYARTRFNTSATASSIFTTCNAALRGLISTSPLASNFFAKPGRQGCWRRKNFTLESKDCVIVARPTFV